MLQNTVVTLFPRLAYQAHAGVNAVSCSRSLVPYSDLPVIVRQCENSSDEKTARHLLVQYALSHAWCMMPGEMPRVWRLSTVKGMQ
jgi:hypothetical protein